MEPRASASGCAPVPNRPRLHPPLLRRRPGPRGPRRPPRRPPHPRRRRRRRRSREGCGDVCAARAPAPARSLQRDLAGAPLDLLWITHQHSDHIGGAPDVLATRAGEALRGQRARPRQGRGAARARGGAGPRRRGASRRSRAPRLRPCPRPPSAKLTPVAPGRLAALLPRRRERVLHRPAHRRLRRRRSSSPATPSTPRRSCSTRAAR